MGTFNTDFDFSTLLNSLTDEINRLQMRFDECEKTCADMDACAGYDGIKLTVNNDCAAKMDRLTDEIAGYQESFNLLTSVQNISAEQKALLHSMWKLTTVPSRLYIYMMAYNHAEMLLDTDIITVTSDNANSLDAKKMVANIIMGKYRMTRYCVF